MTPRELDADVVQARLGLVTTLLDDLDSLGAVTVDILNEQRIVRHAVERMLSQVVEMAVSINGHVAATVLEEAPADYRASFSLAAAAGLFDGELLTRLQPSVGLRNVLAHEYVDVDLKIVAAAVDRARRDCRDYVRSVSQWLVERSG